MRLPLGSRPLTGRLPGPADANAMPIYPYNALQLASVECSADLRASPALPPTSPAQRPNPELHTSRRKL